MRLRDIVRAEKRIVDAGEWESGKMPKTAFPLSASRNKAYRLGNRRWRVVRFEALGASLRLLVNYNQRLAQFQAMLGLQQGQDTTVLARVEFHHTHDGWHAHVCCDANDAVPGIRVGPWNRRMCGQHTKFARQCPMKDDEAYRMAVDIFQLDKVAGKGFL